MSKRFKSSLIYSFVTALLAAILRYLFISYSGRTVESLLESTFVFGVVMFVVFFLYSYMISCRRL